MSNDDKKIYDLPFHEAVRIAVEHGLDVERADGVMFYYDKQRVNLLPRDEKAINTDDICYHIGMKWRMQKIPTVLKFQINKGRIVAGNEDEVEDLLNNKKWDVTAEEVIE